MRTNKLEYCNDQGGGEQSPNLEKEPQGIIWHQLAEFKKEFQSLYDNHKGNLFRAFAKLQKKVELNPGRVAKRCSNLGSAAGFSVYKRNFSCKGDSSDAFRLIYAYNPTTKTIFLIEVFLKKSGRQNHNKERVSSFLEKLKKDAKTEKGS